MLGHQVLPNIAPYVCSVATIEAPERLCASVHPDVLA